MRVWHGVIAFLVLTSLTLAASGPNDRQVTDPKSVTSMAKPGVHVPALEDLFFTRLIDSAVLSPDGTEVAITTNITGSTNLWKVSASGSWPVQLIRSNERQTDPAWSPDSHWIAYAQDKGGNELRNIYIVPRAGGAPINLTNTPDIREQSPVWSHAGKLIACEYKPKGRPSYDLAVIDVATHTIRKLTDEKDPQESWRLAAFSPDDRTLYATRWSTGHDDGDVYAVDVATGKASNLTEHQGKVVNDSADVSSDGKSILMVSNEKGGYRNLAILDLASKKRIWVTDTQWEVWGGAFSPDGTHFTYAINADGRSSLFLGDRRSGKSKEIKLASGFNSLAGAQHFSPDGHRILVQHEAKNTPADLWIYDDRTQRARQLTFMAVGGVGPESLPAAEPVHYKSFDGKIITAVLAMPFNLKRDGANPAILLPHGGPTWEARDTWYSVAEGADVQALVSRGYIVLMPNPRGSTGYGADFQRMNFQDLGGGDLKDELYGLQFLLDTGYVDARRVGVYGSSYGGFMTLMLAARHPDKFAAAVDLYGPLDWYTMLKNADPWLSQYIRSLLGDPERDRKIYEEESPIHYVQNIKAPTLVLQGVNDPRVPKEETEQLVTILKTHGNTIDVVYYPDEGHGFDKREHQIDAVTRTIEWFDKHLRNR